jgi:hypothetical protein
VDRWIPARRSARLLAPAIAVLVALLPASAIARNKKEIVAQFIAYEQVPSPADSAGGIAFELQGLWGSPNDVPDLFAFSRDELIAARMAYRQAKHLPPDAFVLVDAEDWFPKDSQGLRWINPFMSPGGATGLFAFRVTVRNRTDRPLRMRDARVHLRTHGSDEATAPSPDLAFYERWILGKEVAMDNRKESPLAAIQSGYVIRHVPYPVGIASAILAPKARSWANADLMGKEVPPRASATGLLLFPVEWGVDTVAVRIALAPTPEGAPSPSRSFRFEFRRAAQTDRWERTGARWIPLSE